jgi:hypothetical protein
MKIQNPSLGSIILTGLSFGKHKFSLHFFKVGEETRCLAECACGYEVEIMQFNSWGGTRELQKRWEEHTASF